MKLAPLVIPLSLFLLVYSSLSPRKYFYSWVLAVVSMTVALVWAPCINYVEGYYRIFGVPTANYLFMSCTLGGIANILRQVRLIRLSRFAKKLIVVSFLFLFWCVCTSFWAVDISNFSIYYAMWVVYIFTFIITLILRGNCTQFDTIKYYKFFTYSVVFCCAIGLIKLFLGISIANPVPLFNTNATVVIVMACFPFLICLRDMKILDNIKFIPLFAVLVLSILFMYSRTGFVGMLVSIMLYILFTRHPLRITAFIFVAAVVFASIIFLSSGPTSSLKISSDSPDILRVFHRLGRAYGEIKEVRLSKGHSGWERIILLREGIRIARERWLLGTSIGLQNYWHYVGDTRLSAVVIPHNTYLTIFAQTGFWGFSLLTLVLIFTFKSLNRARRKAKGNDSKYLFSAFVSYYLCILLMFAMNDYENFAFLWFILGILAGEAYWSEKRDVEISTVAVNAVSIDRGK